jgi:hypothetical protein
LSACLPIRLDLVRAADVGAVVVLVVAVELVVPGEPFLLRPGLIRVAFMGPAEACVFPAD